MPTDNFHRQVKGRTVDKFLFLKISYDWMPVMQPVQDIDLPWFLSILLFVFGTHLAVLRDNYCLCTRKSFLAGLGDQIDARGQTQVNHMQCKCPTQCATLAPISLYSLMKEREALLVMLDMGYKILNPGLCTHKVWVTPLIWPFLFIFIFLSFPSKIAPYMLWRWD